MNNFPKKISVFPLRGAIFFPKTNLPLNIFEKRYVTMVEDALKVINILVWYKRKRWKVMFSELVV